MTQSQPLTIRVPIRGKLFLRIDGTNSEHEVGSFEKTMDVSFGVAGGNVEFRFDQTFWEEAVKGKGVEAPTPTDGRVAGRAAFPVILEVLQAHTQSARNQCCQCGWMPNDTSVHNNAGMQHRKHLAAELINAGLSA